MTSPKFTFSIPELRSCINRATILNAWRKKIKSQLREQLLVDLIEYKDIEIDMVNIANNICDLVYTGHFRPNVPLYYMVEKSRGLCRQMTLSDPRDMLVLQCLSNTLYADLEKSKPTDNAYYQPGKAPHNKDKLTISLTDYGTIASWKRFQNEILNFSKVRNYIVITDVANFYDFINFSHLRNIISSLCNVKESVLDFLIYILNELSWNPDFMPRSEIGLPQMNIEAPRVLANAMLFELDKVATNNHSPDYVRFMDDIDIGVDTIQQAKFVVRDIDITLQARQLRLNSSKTKILNTKKGEEIDHFCVKENRFLDYCADLIHTCREHNKDIDHVKRALRRAYNLWRGDIDNPFRENTRFLRGNGDKIFKRFVGLKHSVEENIDGDDLVHLIKIYPSLRETCFRALSFNKHANTYFYKINDLFAAEMFVDDLAFSLMARFAVHAKFRRNNSLASSARQFVNICMNLDSTVQVHSALIVASKFFDEESLFHLVTKLRERHVNNYWIGRVIGGLYPRFAVNNSVMRDYRQFVRCAKNEQINNGFDLHYRLEDSVDVVKALFSYAKAPNYSYPQKIFHSKALLIYTISRNKSAKNHFAQIYKCHPALRTDPFYRAWFT